MNKIVPRLIDRSISSTRKKPFGKLLKFLSAISRASPADGIKGRWGRRRIKRGGGWCGEIYSEERSSPCQRSDAEKSFRSGHCQVPSSSKKNPKGTVVVLHAIFTTSFRFHEQLFTPRVPLFHWLPFHWMLVRTRRHLLWRVSGSKKIVCCTLRYLANQPFFPLPLLLPRPFRPDSRFLRLTSRYVIVRGWWYRFGRSRIKCNGVKTSSWGEMKFYKNLILLKIGARKGGNVSFLEKNPLSFVALRFDLWSRRTRIRSWIREHPYFHPLPLPQSSRTLFSVDARKRKVNKKEKKKGAIILKTAIGHDFSRQR